MMSSNSLTTIHFTDLIRDTRITTSVLRSAARELGLAPAPASKREELALAIWAHATASDRSWEGFVTSQALSILFALAPDRGIRMGSGPEASVGPEVALSHSPREASMSPEGSDADLHEGVPTREPRLEDAAATRMARTPLSVSELVENVFGEFLSPPPVPLPRIARELADRLASLRLDSEGRRALRRAPYAEGFDDRHPVRGPSSRLVSSAARERESMLSTWSQSLRHLIGTFEVSLTHIADLFERDEDTLEVYSALLPLGYSLYDLSREVESQRALLVFQDARVSREDLDGIATAPLRDFAGRTADRATLDAVRSAQDQRGHRGRGSRPMNQSSHRGSDRYHRSQGRDRSPSRDRPRSRNPSRERSPVRDRSPEHPRSSLPQARPLSHSFRARGRGGHRA